MVGTARKSCSSQPDVSMEDWMRYGLAPYFVMPVIIAREEENFEDLSFVDPRKMDERMWLHVEQRAGLDGFGLCFSGAESWSVKSIMNVMPEHLRFGLTSQVREIWKKSGCFLGHQRSVVLNTRSILMDGLDARLWKRTVSWAPSMKFILQWLLDTAVGELCGTSDSASITSTESVGDENIVRTYEKYDSRLSYEIRTSYRGAMKLWNAHWQGLSPELHKKCMVERQEHWGGPRFDSEAGHKFNSLLAWMPGLRVTEPCRLREGELNLICYHDENTRWITFEIPSVECSLAMALCKRDLDIYPGFLLVSIVPEEELQFPREARVRSWQKFYPTFIKMAQVLHSRIWLMDRTIESWLQLEVSKEMLSIDHISSTDLNTDTRYLVTLLYQQTQLGNEFFAKYLPQSTEITSRALLGSECLWR